MWASGLRRYGEKEEKASFMEKAFPRKSLSCVQRKIINLPKSVQRRRPSSQQKGLSPPKAVLKVTFRWQSGTITLYS